MMRLRQSLNGTGAHGAQSLFAASAVRVLRRTLSGLLLAGRKPPPDGEIVRLGPSDMVALTLHYAALDPEDRHARFNGKIKFAGLLRRYRDMRDSDQTFLGIFEGERLVAACEISPDRGDHAAAEIALSVRKAWQGRHYGQRLLHKALRLVRAEGRQPYMLARSDNAPLIGLAVSEGGQVERNGREVEIRFDAGDGA